MIRRPRPHEIKLLPQIENEADLRYRRVGLGPELRAVGCLLSVTKECNRFTKR